MIEWNNEILHELSLEKQRAMDNLYEGISAGQIVRTSWKKPKETEHHSIGIVFILLYSYILLWGQRAYDNDWVHSKM